MSDDDLLDLSADDLDEEESREAEAVPTETAGLPLPPAPLLPGREVEAGEDVLDISLEDLDVSGGPAPSGLPPRVSGPLTGPVESLPGDEMVPKKKKSAVETVVTATLNVLPLALAGGLGGLLAWAILEPFTTDAAAQESLGEVLRDMALYGAGMGGGIAMAIGAVEGIVGANVRRALQGAGLGLLIGVVGGAFGGVLGQILYGSMHGGSDSLPVVAQIAVRAIGWALIGACIGLAPGFLTRSTRKVVNGLVGGLLGGGVGGFLFDPIGIMLGGGELSRMVAISVLGAAAGGAIGLIEEIRKEAWLIITAGPLSGKQFILYNPVTTVGRSPKADIMLAKEAGAADLHCRISRSGNRMMLEDLSGGRTLVNARPVGSTVLRSGDLITIGGTQLTFHERAAADQP